MHSVPRTGRKYYLIIWLVVLLKNLSHVSYYSIMDACVFYFPYLEGEVNEEKTTTKKPKL